MTSSRPPFEPEGRRGRFSRRVISNASCARRADLSTLSESIPPDCDAPAIRVGKSSGMRLTVALRGGNISPCPPRRELDSPVACGNVGAVIPRDLNAAHWFVDRHVEEGRDGRLAIVYEGQRLTYGDVYAGANRVGNMLRRLGVTIEQRVVLLLPDGPEFVSSFWGALKIGAVPVPTNTLLKARDYDYILKEDRKSTRLNSSHSSISYAVFCLKKKKKKNRI